MMEKTTALAYAQKKLEPIIGINDKFNRALELRLKISNRRREAISLLESRIMEKSLSATFEEDKSIIITLRQCYSDEQRLMNVFDSAREKTRSELQYAISILDKHKKDREVQLFFRRLLNISPRDMEKLLLNYLVVSEDFYNYFEKIKERLRMEKRFLDNRDNALFKIYLNLLDEELKKEDEIMEKLDEIFKKVSKKLPREIIFRTTQVSSMAVIFSMIVKGQDIFENIPEPLASILPWLLSGVFFLITISTTVLLYHKSPEERRVFEEKIRSIKKIIKRSGV